MDLDTQLPIHLIKNIQIFFNIPSFALLTNYEDLTAARWTKVQKARSVFSKIIIN